MDRREHYRVEVGRGSAFEVGYLTWRGSTFSGRLVDLSEGGVGLRLLSWPSVLHPSVGEVAALSFPSLVLNRPLMASAFVRHREEAGGNYRYGLQFTDRRQLDGRLWPVFHRLFNRRRSVRVAPDPGLPVEVSAQGVRLQVAVIDISQRGVGIRIRADEEPALAGSDHLEIVVALPEGRDHVHLDGIVRSRRLTGGEIDYGIEFDLGHSGDADRYQSAIGEYMTRRAQAA